MAGQKWAVKFLKDGVPSRLAFQLAARRARGQDAQRERQRGDDGQGKHQGVTRDPKGRTVRAAGDCRPDHDRGSLLSHVLPAQTAMAVAACFGCSR